MLKTDVIRKQILNENSEFLIFLILLEYVNKCCIAYNPTCRYQ